MNAIKKLLFSLLLLTAASWSEPVVFGGEVLFEVHKNVGSATPEMRAKNISLQLGKLLADMSISPNDLELRDLSYGSEIHVGPQVVAVVLDADAKQVDLPRLLLAQHWRDAMREALRKNRAMTPPLRWQQLLSRVGAATLVWLTCGWALLKFRQLCRRQLYGMSRLAQGSSGQQRMLRFVRRALTRVLEVATVFSGLILVFAYIDFLLLCAPPTTLLGYRLLRFALLPLGVVGASIWHYLPNLGFLVVIASLAYAVLGILSFLFRELQNGDLVVPGFHKEWALPSYQLLRGLVLVLTLIAAFPYIPGAQTEAFKGVSLLVGVIVSMASGSVVSNLFAGIVLVYTLAFRVGDRVRIGDCEGDVVSLGLLVTRLRTNKDELISLPNSVVMSGPIQNFSTLPSVVLHTTVTIGYDVPWKNVEAALLKAASRTEGLEKDPTPFVLQTSLNDFHVSYQINAHTRLPNRKAGIYSQLHSNIQDAFNEAGIEIMSPTIAALRDANTTTIPENYREDDYQAPGFRVQNL